MMAKIIAVGKLEYTRSKTFFYLGILFPSFAIVFLLLTGLTLSIFATPEIINTNISSQQELFLLRALIWSVQFLVMFQSVILIPWLFNNKELDIYLLTSSVSPLLIVLGRVLSVSMQQIVLSFSLSIMSLIYFVIVLNFQVNIQLLFSILLSLLLAIVLINALIFGLTLFIKSFSSSIFTVNSILSLYLFGIPLFMIVNISYGLVPGEFNLINLALQLQSINNAMITFNEFSLFAIDPVVTFLVLSELIFFCLLIVLKGRKLRV